jgi:hypothetical protein
MQGSADAKTSDVHAKRIMFDIVQWHERLEQLAEMRRQEHASTSRVTAARQPQKEDADRVARRPVT